MHAMSFSIIRTWRRRVEKQYFSHPMIDQVIMYVRGVCTAAPELLDLFTAGTPSDLFEEWSGSARFGCTLLAPTQLYWYATLPPEPSCSDKQGARAALSRAFSQVPLATAVLARTPDNWLTSEPLASSWIDSGDWHDNAGVVRVGSAVARIGHDLQQAPAMSVESAAVLGLCLAHSPFLKAVRQYQALRQERIAMVARASDAEGQMSLQTGVWALFTFGYFINLICFGYCEVMTADQLHMHEIVCV